MRTIYYTATTLDGYIADQHDSLAWLLVQDQDVRGPMNYDDFYAQVGAIAMGATTYEWVVDHLAATGEPWTYQLPGWVFTHRELPRVEGDLRFVSDPVPQVHAEMAEAAQGKDIWIVGGGDLAGQFADAGLLDEIVVSIAPVTLGEGRPLFPRRYGLELLEVAQNRDFVCARYGVASPEAWTDKK